MSVARDYPFSAEEQRWNVALEKKLGEPLEWDLETVTLLPPVVFDKDGKLDDTSHKALALLKSFSEYGRIAQIVITA